METEVWCFRTGVGSSPSSPHRVEVTMSPAPGASISWTTIFKHSIPERGGWRALHHRKWVPHLVRLVRLSPSFVPGLQPVFRGGDPLRCPLTTPPPSESRVQSVVTAALQMFSSSCSATQTPAKFCMDTSVCPGQTATSNIYTRRLCTWPHTHTHNKRDWLESLKVVIGQMVQRYNIITPLLYHW